MKGPYMLQMWFGLLLGMQSGTPQHTRIFDKMDIINIITNTYSHSIKAVDIWYRNTIYSTGIPLCKIPTGYGPQRVLYSPPCLTTGIRWIQWIPVDFRWIQQDYIIVIKRLQIYLVDPVDFWWIVVNFWWISGGSGGHVMDCGGFLVDLWICDRL